ncbi:MAG: hypothetical protein IJ068_06030 [Bacilli bacterium]|nr:hypothetical protein [Bacilli bacterium]
MEKEIFEIKNQLKTLEKHLNDELIELKQRRLNLQNMCNHSLVLKFTDKKPHKVGPIYTCACPICDKTIKLYGDKKIEESEFKNSRLIDLTNFNIGGSLKYDSIVNFIMENYDDFYKSDLNINLLSDSIHKFIEEKEYIYDIESTSFYYDPFPKKKSYFKTKK